ncbi:MAG TPA: c-type cytochrome domain-containing protein [Candidatus Deferrimicrobium sp.]|nr:c-type cytochrome domain-containing protein [Candidatus Deferrimicrobium sp.]
MKWQSVILPAGLLVMAVLSFSCGSDSNGTSSDGGTIEPTFTNVNQRILQPSCGTGLSSCHGGSSPTSGLSLTSYTSIMNHVTSQGKTVDPGSASTSNLYLKTTATPPFGERMPKGGAPLSLSMQQLIRDWINAGALNN